MNSRNIIHVNYPNTGSPFCIQNREIVNLPTRQEESLGNERDIGWRSEVTPNAPPQSDADHAPPPYSSVVKNAT